MSDLSTTPIGRSAAAAVARPPVNGHPSAAVASAATVRPSDRVEFSQAAQLLSRLQDLPDIRFDLVARVKSEIAAGTYETPEKLDAAIDGLLEDLR